MNLSKKSLKNIGYILIGIALFSLAYIVAYEWRNENNVPALIKFTPILLPLIANYLFRQAKNKSEHDNKI
jgi:hypothetical protein